MQITEARLKELIQDVIDQLEYLNLEWGAPEDKRWMNDVLNGLRELWRKRATTSILRGLACDIEELYDEIHSDRDMDIMSTAIRSIRRRVRELVDGTER